MVLYSAEEEAVCCALSVLDPRTDSPCNFEWLFAGGDAGSGPVLEGFCANDGFTAKKSCVLIEREPLKLFWREL